MVLERKNLRFEPKKLEEWDEFLLKNFKTKRVLSKVMTEAMDQYIKNFKTIS